MVKDNLIARCANMLAVYRKHCATTTNAGQLILPECMKLLPLYINSLLKSDAFSGGKSILYIHQLMILFILFITLNVFFLFLF